jgi:ubiquinone/menaquinone biosynthesis C-methylase UbiE
MIIKFFLSLTDHPAVRRIVWKPIYEMLAKRFNAPDWTFMNYGYAPSENEPVLLLDDRDEINRYSIQMYHYLALKTGIQGKDILEIGSGRGGGAHYPIQKLGAGRVAGLDIAYNAVKMARKNYNVPHLSFQQGTAEKLPFSDDTFDIVINVESSHTYGSIELFLSQAKRVLREGGYLLLADFRLSEAMIHFSEQLAHSELKLILEENISQNVIEAIEGEEESKQKRINENFPPWMHKLFKEFAGVVNGRVHSNLKSGALKYYRFVLRK